MRGKPEESGPGRRQTSVMHCKEKSMEQCHISPGDIQSAMENQEFQVYLQPKLRVGLDRVALDGFEALLRWKKGGTADDFVCPPDVFIPAAEEWGCITPLTLYVVEEVCKYIKYWRLHGVPSVPVAVNVSPKDLASDEFVPLLLELLSDREVAFGGIQLEITETALVSDSPKLVKEIETLRSHGIKIAIDDFGTGYASLACLKTLPADILKVDGMFLRNIHEDPVNQHILESILHLARGMGFDLVYEGIETREEAEYIRNLGAHVAQGFFYAPPLPPEEALCYLKQAAAGGGASDSRAVTAVG